MHSNTILECWYIYVRYTCNLCWLRNIKWNYYEIVLCGIPHMHWKWFICSFCIFLFSIFLQLFLLIWSSIFSVRHTTIGLRQAEKMHTELIAFYSISSLLAFDFMSTWSHIRVWCARFSFGSEQKRFVDKTNTEIATQCVQNESNWIRKGKKYFNFVDFYARHKIRTAKNIFFFYFGLFDSFLFRSPVKITENKN